MKWSTVHSPQSTEQNQGQRKTDGGFGAAWNGKGDLIVANCGPWTVDCGLITNSITVDRGLLAVD